MEIVIFEDNIKYDAWMRPVLVFPIVLLVVLGILFFIDARYSDLFPREPAAKSELASFVLFASVVFVLIVYWIVLPRKIYVTQEGIKLKLGVFCWNIRFKTIESIKPATGILVLWAHTFITSYGSQIEIVRKWRLNVRVCPDNRELFLKYANTALADWRHRHQSGSHINWR